MDWRVEHRDALDLPYTATLEKMEFCLFWGQLNRSAAELLSKGEEHPDRRLSVYDYSVSLPILPNCTSEQPLMGVKPKIIAALLIGICMQISAQVPYAAKRRPIRYEIGGGMDVWATDYSQKWKWGPAAWAGADLWHGLGILAEGHSMIAGASDLHYKYFVGEGGVRYASHRWTSVIPYAKGEMGFAGLSVARSATSRSHDTRNTWALGGGVEYHSWKNLWTRADYTYDFFPDFLSYITFQKHTLNPNGVSIGVSYHFD